MVDSRRVRKLRSEIINFIPRVPNNKASRSYMESQPTSWLISTFVTWRQRQVPAKPRRVSLWSGGITPPDFEAAKPRLRGLLQKVETGQDLMPHLSYLVDTKGVILPGASPADKGKPVAAIGTFCLGCHVIQLHPERELARGAFQREPRSEHALF